MLRGRCYREGHRTDETVEVGNLGALARREKTFVWLDLDESDLSQLPAIGEQLGLHPIELDQAADRHVRPGVRVFGEHLAIALRLLAPDGEVAPRDADIGIVGRSHDSQIKAFCNRDFLVTIRIGCSTEDLDGVAEAWESQPELLAHGGGYAVYVLVDRVVDGYLSMVERYEDGADDLEDVIFEDGDRRGPDAEIRDRLFRLKRETVLLRRAATPLREGIQLLASDPRLAAAPLQPYLRDVLDHVVRVDEMLDNIRDLLTSLLDLRVAQAANRMNEVMKSLTAWASILLVPTLLSGIWGMNFDQMPELHWQYGYLVALGTIVGSAVGLYAWFRFRKHWL